MDQATLGFLEDGLRHIKGLVGALDRWVAMQKARVPPPSQTPDKKKG